VLGTGATYQWGTGGVVGSNPLAGSTNNTFSVTPGSTTSYWVSVTGAVPCGSPAGGASATVTVNTASTAPTGISGTTLVCNGTGTVLSETGGALGTGATYQWGTGGVVGTGPIAGATNSTYSVTPGSTTSYWVSVTGITPCGSPVGGASATVTVNTTSTAPTGVAGTALLCNGTGTTLTATGGTLGTGATYQWGTGSLGANPIAGATNITYSVTPGSTTNYWVSVTGVAPCGSPSGGGSITVTVNNPSTAPTGISGTTTFCNGTGTTLTATGGILGTGANYQWGTGNVVGTNPVSGATNISYSVTPVGSTDYWVSITGVAPCGSPAGGVSTSVTVNPIPVITATPADNSICSGTAPAVVLSSSVAGTTYTWSVVQGTGITGGSSSNGATIAQVLSNSSNSTAANATYTIIGTANNCSASASAVITVNPIPVITATPSGVSICSGTAPGISLSSSTAGTTYSWSVVETGNVTGGSPGNGTPISQTLSNSSNSTAGTATYTITGAANSCTASTSAIITINPIPAITATPANDTICSGTAPVIAITSSAAGTTYTWSVAQGIGITGGNSGNGTPIAQTLSNSSNSIAGTATYTIIGTANTCTSSFEAAIIIRNSNNIITGIQV